MSLIENERMKLLATALNNLGVATIVTGVVAPIAANLYGHGAISSDTTAILIGIVWLFTGVGLHLVAQTVLGGMRP